MEECIICFEETDKFITFNCCDHKTCMVCYPLIINNTGKCPICQREIIHIKNAQIIERHVNIQREINYCKMGCITFMITIIIFYIIKYKI
jgi:hypothetical protein